MRCHRPIAVAALLLFGLTACQHKPAKRSAFMKSTENVGITAAELSVLIRDLADRYGGEIEVAADRIMQRTTDVEIRRKALWFKMRAIPDAYAAIFRADPLVALLDTWAYTLQLIQFLEEGPSRDVFGPLQPIALDALHRLEAEIEQVAIRVSATGEITRGREFVHSWVDEHPIEDSALSRDSMAAHLSDFRQAARVGSFRAVGKLTGDLADLTARMNLLADHLPQQARWQAEYLVLEHISREEIDTLLSQTAEITEALSVTGDLAEQAPTLVERERDVLLEAVRVERLATLDWADEEMAVALQHITNERIATIAELRLERAIVLEAITAERIAVFEAVEQERTQTVQEVEALTGRLMEQSTAVIEEAIDHLFVRAAQLGAVLVLVLAVVGFLLVRALGRSRAAA